MPDTNPTRQPGSSLGLKAAALAVTIVGGILLAAFLATMLPQKQTTWRSALPTPSMSPAQARAALVRSEFLHEAEIRPQLIRAGFMDEHDLAPSIFYGIYFDHKDGVSTNITNVLWALRALPEVHDQLVAVLLDAGLAPDERLYRFSLLAEMLNAMTATISDGGSLGDFRQAGSRPRLNRREAAEWFAMFNEDPQLALDYDVERRAHRRKGGVTHAEALAFARRVFPVIMRLTQDELDGALAAARELEDGGQEQAGSRPRSLERMRMERLDELSRFLPRTLEALWNGRADEAFMAQALAMLQGREGSAGERLAVIPLMTEKPGLPLDEYLFWAEYRDDLNSLTSCVGKTPYHYSYTFGCGDKLEKAAKKMLKAQGTMVLGGGEGPGMILDRVDGLRPEAGPGKLYLLIDMSHALADAPPYDLSRGHPIFRGMLYRHYNNQPMVLPLNQGSEADRALVDWYAAQGWKEGRTLLFRADGRPEDIARHWGTVHLLWWPKDAKEADPDPALAYLHPESGHFMLGILPHLKGRSVDRFLGPVNALWFGRMAVDDSGWVEEKYMARREQPAVAVPATPIRSPLAEWLRGPQPVEARQPRFAEATATIIFGKEIRAEQSKTFNYEHKLKIVRRMLENFPEDATSPKAMFAFVDKSLTGLYSSGIKGIEQQGQVVEYYWRFRDDPAATRMIREILADSSVSAYERLRKTRRVLGLPQTKRNR